MATFVDKPWDGSASRWPTPEAYCSACLIDLNPPGEPKSKARCYLPVKEPGGAYNKAALRAAASVLGGGRGGVNVPDDEKAKARRRIQSLMADAGTGS